MRRSSAACAASALSAISVQEVALGTSCLQENLDELHLSDSVLLTEHAVAQGLQFKLEKRISLYEAQAASSNRFPHLKHRAANCTAHRTFVHPHHHLFILLSPRGLCALSSGSSSGRTGMRSVAVSTPCWARRTLKRPISTP